MAVSLKRTGLSLIYLFFLVAQCNHRETLKRDFVTNADHCKQHSCVEWKKHTGQKCCPVSWSSRYKFQCPLTATRWCINDKRWPGSIYMIQAHIWVEDRVMLSLDTFSELTHLELCDVWQSRGTWQCMSACFLDQQELQMTNKNNTRRHMHCSHP